MDFVGADEQVVTQTQFGHAHHLVFAEDAPHGIMRIAQQEHPCAVGDGTRKKGVIHTVASVGVARQLHSVRRCVGRPGGVEDRRIDRRLDEQPVTRLEKCLRRQIERRHHARQENDRLRRDRPTVKLLQTRDNRFYQRRRLRLVPEDAVLHPRPQRRDHRLRRDEVHIRHPHRQHVSAVILPFHALRPTTVNDAIEVVSQRKPPGEESANRRIIPQLITRNS